MKHTNIIRNDHPLSVLDRFLDFGLRGLDDYNYALPGNTSKRGKDLTNSQIEVFEEDDNYVATLDLPGVKKKDIELHVEGRGLRIRATRSAREKDSSEEQSLEQSLVLGENINPDKIHAKLEDGVLEITLPKAEATKARQIAVK